MLVIKDTSTFLNYKLQFCLCAWIEAGTSADRKLGGKLGSVVSKGLSKEPKPESHPCLVEFPSCPQGMLWFLEASARDSVHPHSLALLV